MRGIRLSSWFGRTPGGAAPVLSAFVDNLDLDPPEASFVSSSAGTLTIDFHASATPPAKGAGDIATFSDTMASGANDISLDLSPYVGETGYLHIRGTNAGGDSNILTSQVITVVAVENLFLWTEDFSNAAWTKVGVAITPNDALAPDGNTTADKVFEQTNTGVHDLRRVFTPPATGNYTMSFHVSQDELATIDLIMQVDASNFAVVQFDVLAGSVTSETGGGTGAIVPAANGYYRCGITANITNISTNRLFILRLVKGGSGSYTGNGTDGVHAWGAQLVSGSSMLTYTPRTT